ISSVLPLAMRTHGRAVGLNSAGSARMHAATCTQRWESHSTCSPSASYTRTVMIASHSSDADVRRAPMLARGGSFDDGDRSDAHARGRRGQRHDPPARARLLRLVD